MSETTTTTARGGPRARFTVNDADNTIIRRFVGEADTVYHVSALQDVWDDLATECAIHYLQRGVSFDEIAKGDPIPSRIEGEKRARAVKAPSDTREPTIWMKAIAKVRAADQMKLHADLTENEAHKQALSWAGFLSSAEKNALKKTAAVIYAHAELTGTLSSLDDVLASVATNAEAGETLEEAAD